MLAAEDVDEGLPLRVPGALEYRRLDRIGAAVCQRSRGRDGPRCARSSPAGRRRPSTSRSTRCARRCACAAPRCPRRAGRAARRRARPAIPAAGSRRCPPDAAAGDRRTPASRRGRRGRRRRAGGARRPGCRRAPGRCRDSPAGCRRCARRASLSRPMPYTGCRWPCAAAVSRDVDQVAQVILHRRDFGEPVERADDEEGVAQPAVAVVPVALGSGRFGNAGRHRRHDRAGLLVHAELERDRRADHGVLPFERHRQRARPVLPVVGGALLEIARGFGDAGADRLVDAEDQVRRPVEQVTASRRGRR